jgi:hypothetical protein
LTKLVEGHSIQIKIQLHENINVNKGETSVGGLKFFVDHHQLVKCKSTITKTLWPALTGTSSKDRWIGAYSIGLTILWKLSCPKNRIRRRECLQIQFISLAD